MTYMLLTFCNVVKEPLFPLFSFVSVDNEPPALRCPDDITRLVTSGNLNGAVIDWSPATVTDNSGVPITPVLGSNQPQPNTFFVFGSYTITYTATDPSGNTNDCSFIVTVGKPFFRIHGYRYCMYFPCGVVGDFEIILTSIDIRQ